MKKVTLSIRVSERTKQRLEQSANKIGTTVSRLAAAVLDAAMEKPEAKNVHAHRSA
jgi:hypothetical protein